MQLHLVHLLMIIFSTDTKKESYSFLNSWYVIATNQSCHYLLAGCFEISAPVLNMISHSQYSITLLKPNLSNMQNISMLFGPFPTVITTLFIIDVKVK